MEHTQTHFARAVCPGSFDPVTFGHLDIVERAARHFDELLVAILRNPSKEPLFTLEERIDMIERAVADFGNVRVDTFEGLLVDYARNHHAGAIVKGLRAVTDFDYEIQMAHMNTRLTGIETFFLPTSTDFSYLSSSLVKDVARHGGNIDGLVPEHVVLALKERYGN
ncbi:MAG: pantetheine-phosphate adenylyltransferase [Acidimicrobiia bacterium]|nr:pantetheine-phosphate adenylyltransferase [Acidimicrobiia bacterium]